MQPAPTDASDLYNKPTERELSALTNSFELQDNENEFVDESKEIGPSELLLDKNKKQWFTNGDDEKKLEATQDEETKVEIHQPDIFESKFQVRATEETLLLEAYQRLSCTEKPLTTELVLISGPTGVGKTTLAQSLRDRVLADGGIFCHGKFDSLQSLEPYGAFVSAFTEFANTVVERGEEVVASMRCTILAAVGTEGRVLTDTIPALAQILGGELERRQAIPSTGILNQFKFLFRMFLRAVCSPERPLVLFLDDIHWADESSLMLLQSLATDVSNRGILFLVTIQEDIVPCRKLEDGLDQLLGSDVHINKIMLQNLQDDAVSSLLSNILNVPECQVASLSEIIYRQTNGNLFFIKAMLRSLHQDGLVHFDDTTGSWIWNEHDIRLTFQQTSVGELVTDRIFQLPKEAQDLLKVAACLGSKLNVEILSHFLSDPVESYLEIAADVGLLSAYGKPRTFEFAHDGIREATYNAIPSAERPSFHLHIGRALKSVAVDKLDALIFVVLSQLEKGGHLILDPQERSEVAALCLRGGAQAVQSSSFKTASTYFLFGVKLLDERSWEDDYEMCLELYNCATEIEYCNGHFTSLDSLVERAISKSRCFRDTIRVRTFQVYSLGGRNLISDAMSHGLDILKTLGETFPRNPNRFDWFTALRKTWRSFRSKSTEAILRLPLMHNQDKLAAMQILNLIFSFAYTNRPFMAPLIACRMVDLTLNHGLCAISSPGMMAFASLLIRWGKGIDEGYRCGNVAFAIYEKFGEKAWWGRLCAGFYSCVSAWIHPLTDNFAGLKAAHRVALETGDIEIAMVNANLYCWTGFGVHPIPVLEKEVRSFVDNMRLHGQKSNLFMIVPLWQVCQNLLGMANGDPKVLTGSVMDQEEYLRQAEEKNPHSAVWMHFDLAFLAYLFGDYESAYYHVSKSRTLVRFPFCSFTLVSVIMFDGLICLALCRKDRKRRGRLIRLARKAIKVLTKWSMQAPINFLGHLHLLKAEFSAATGNYLEAASNFTCAIALTSKGSLIMLEALANELAGRSCVEQDRLPAASSYFQEAHRLYVKWGGFAKADHLRKELENLFQ